ncbi:hypothetical protein Y032_0625g793 [Ancylostoma ceylanicum]|uniref:ABC transporter domain-containing protein n=1 Tax=Ancylostoma ceylanicum TaxID=53326 RepID=A0A016WMD6_9BILA|nr:hypothetical protein Y032_0625g793 [Ancylostoma ceylanicum]
MTHLTQLLNTPSATNSVKLHVHAQVVNAVSSKFPDAALVTLQEDSLNLKWNIPTKPDDRMSTLLGTVQSLAEEIPIRDFCLSQASLEDVFVILNHKYKEEEENRI